MKKNYILFTLLLLMSAAWTDASALIWDLGSRKTEFKVGDKFVIVGEHPSTWWGNSNYANGYDKSSAALLESCVIELEATGETGLIKGYPSYYFKQISTGKYYGDGGMKEDKKDASKYEILVNSPEKDKDAKIPGAANPEVLTVAGEATDESVVFVTYRVSEGTKSNVFLANGGSTPTTWTYSDTNTWKVYSVTSRESPIDELAALIKYYTDDLKIIHEVSLTNAPGFTLEEAANRYNVAMEAALDAVEAEKSDEICKAAYAELEAAKLNADTMMIPMREGYFRFRSAKEGWVNAGTTMGMYIDTDNKLKWKAIVADNASFIFKVTKSKDEKNWVIQSLSTDRYINTIDTNDTAIPTTTEPTTDQTFKGLGLGQWNIANTANGKAYHAANNGGTSSTVVTWNGDRHSPSAWFVDEILNQNLIDSLTQALIPVKMKEKMKTLVATAKTTYAKGLIDLGYVKNGGQFRSNAPQSGEGDLSKLIDGDPATIFHSRWNGDAVNEAHYLQVHLDAPIDKFNMYTHKRGSNNNNRPDLIQISASNDTVTWTDVAVLPNEKDTLPYANTTPEFNTTEMIDLKSSYKYIRFTVKSVACGGKPAQGVIGQENGYTFHKFPFFTYGEFQLYPETRYDLNSQNYRMPEAKVLKELMSRGDTLKLVTEADLTALQAAIDAYNLQYVDTSRMASEITKSQAMVDNAVIGEEMGNSTQEDVDVLQAAIAVAKTVNLFDPTSGDLLTRAELDAAVNTLVDARNAYAASVKSIVPGNWYYIQNRMTTDAEGTRYDAGICTVEGLVKWGGLVSGSFSETDNAAYMWRFVAMSDSTFAVQNMATGQYFGTTDKASVGILQQNTPAPYFVKYIGAAQFSLVPNIEKGALPLHAQAAGEEIVGWNDGVGSASAWTFVEAVATEVRVKDIEDNSISVVTLPYEYTVGSLYAYNSENLEFDVEIFKIVGKEGPAGAATAVNLQKYDSQDVIPAGTPVIVVLGDPAEYTEKEAKGFLVCGIETLNGENPESNLDVVATPLSANGLVGVFNNRTLPRDGVGLLESGKLRVVKATELTGFLSGYIVESQIAAIDGATIDKVLEIGEGPALDIDGVTGDKTGKNGKIYTIDGVYAGSTVTGLKPGLYIINGKVVRL